jgi:hypothetical protein
VGGDTWEGDFCFWEHYFHIGGLYCWFWGGACYRIVLLVFLEELVGGLSQGAPVARNFGLGGQEIVRNPGARESDRSIPSWLGG